MDVESVASEQGCSTGHLDQFLEFAVAGKVGIRRLVWRVFGIAQ